MPLFTFELDGEKYNVDLTSEGGEAVWQALKTLSAELAQAADHDNYHHVANLEAEIDRLKQLLERRKAGSNADT